MLSQESVSPLDSLSASIQGRVGEFLALKSKLIKMKQSPNIMIKTKAQQLYGAQVKLEEDLKKALDAIDAAKEGSWSFSEVVSVGAFYYSMTNHIEEVGDLETQYAGTPGAQSAGISTTTLLLIGGGVLAFFLLKR